MIKSILKSERGAGLVGTMVATGVVGITSVAVATLLTSMSKAKSDFRSDIGMATLTIDIKKTLISNELCNQFLKPENSSFNENTKNIRIRTMSQDLISGNSDLPSYHLTKLSVTAGNTVDLGTGPSGHQFFVSELTMTGARKFSGRELAPRSLGPLFVETDSSGAIVNCNMSSLETLVQCQSGEIKVSQGENQIPNCMSPAEIIAGLCPSGTVIGVSGNGVNCMSPPTPPAPAVVTRTVTSVQTQPECTADPAICAAYRNNLGRMPDQAGAKFYGDLLKGKSGAERAKMLQVINNDIAGSNEASGLQRTAAEVQGNLDFQRRTGTTGQACTGGVNCR